MALLTECESCCASAGYKHGTPDGVRELLFVRGYKHGILTECESCCGSAGYKHGTPDGVRELLFVRGYKHHTPNGV